MLRGVRLFRLGIYSTSNSQRASAPRGFERAHAQKHPSTDGHESTLIKESEPRIARIPRIGERSRLATWFESLAVASRPLQEQIHISRRHFESGTEEMGFPR